MRVRPYAGFGRMTGEGSCVAGGLRREGRKSVCYSRHLSQRRLREGLWDICKVLKTVAQNPNFLIPELCFGCVKHANRFITGDETEAKRIALLMIRLEDELDYLDGVSAASMYICIYIC